jgi:hypothetical protein
VLDADGLWALAGHLDWVFSRDAPTVLTPHAGELGRLLGRPSAWVGANRLDACRRADDTGRGRPPQGRRHAGRRAGPQPGRRRPGERRPGHRRERRRAHRCRRGRFSLATWIRREPRRDRRRLRAGASQIAAERHGQAG